MEKVQVIPQVRTVLPRGQPPPTPWPAQGQWTYADWLRLPDDGYRYEVLNGVLYMTPPATVRHQKTLGSLAYAFTHFVRERRLGEVIVALCGVRLPGHPVPVQPDILFVAAARLDIVGEDYVEGAPDLVVEVLSPSNWLYDRREKFQVYLAAGVPEYWIVDPRAGTIEVFWREGSEYVLQGCYETGQTVPSRALPGFAVAVDEVLGS